MPDGALFETASSVAGSDAVRPGTPADAISGVVPNVVIEPRAREIVGAVLQWASRDKLRAVVRGSGTKLGWGNTPREIDLAISTLRLNSVIAHRYGDLTATVEAGARLSDVNRTLGEHRQWIPLDPPFGDRATIGGIAATNDSGPRRHRYGAPRDLIIGVEFVRANGLLAKGGGIVVKNVAGYDLPRMLTGSFGSLGVIVAATFKLYPLTAASKTVVVELPSPDKLGELAGRILSSNLTPTSLEFATGPLQLLLRFESIETSVDRQCETAGTMIAEAGFAPRVRSGADEAVIWEQHRNFGDSGDGARVKVSVLPTELARTLNLIERLAGANGYAAAGRAGLGVFLLTLHGDVSLQKKVIDGLRAALPVGRGSAVLVHASAELKAQVDVWGPIGDGLPLMQTVKRQFDPAGVLNPGRGPGGL
jgi:glycolate oxidase FAD binding subunit